MRSADVFISSRSLLWLHMYGLYVEAAFTVGCDVLRPRAIAVPKVLKTYRIAEMCMKTMIFIHSTYEDGALSTSKNLASVRRSRPWAVMERSRGIIKDAVIVRA